MKLKEFFTRVVFYNPEYDGDKFATVVLYGGLLLVLLVSLFTT